MLILSDPAHFRPDPGKPLILAVGNFDGYHLGHQQLVEKVLERSQIRKGRSALLTFREHPQHVLHPSAKPPLLTSTEHRLMLLQQSGLELCFLLPFTPEFARVEAACFVRTILHETLQVGEVYLGYNARFGRDRQGDSALMHRLSGELGFHYEPLGAVQAGDEIVSSSRIRTLVREGRLEEVEKCLNRPFSILAEVTAGEGRGRKLGFPTANLRAENEILPPLGVYPVAVRETTLSLKEMPEQKGREFEVLPPKPWRPGVLNYGYRPTFGGEKPEAVPEVHILDFQGDLYGKTLEVAFYPRLRGESRFENAEALKARIGKDLAASRRFFAAQPLPPGRD